MVRNPASGVQADTDRARRIAADRGIDVRDTSGPGDGVDLAREATADADQIIACGGDGTVNEVVRGVAEADAFDDVELAVVPTGTGNGFAGKIGVDSVEDAFEILEDGERRRLDVGVADGRPFVESCMGGLIAEASEQTPDERKERFGSLAYVLETLKDAREYEGRSLSVTVGRAETQQWTGEAAMLLMGNARRFFGGEQRQANVEDGELEIVIVEQAPAIDYLAADALDTLLNREAPHLVRLSASELTVTTTDDPMHFSLDGEVIRRRKLDASVRERAMQFRVGDAYDPSPSSWLEE